MKKLFYVLFGLVLTFGMMSCGKDDPDPRHGGGNHGGGGNNEAYTFNANDCWAGYYGDYFGYGTGVYMVQLTQGTVDNNGDLTTAGNSIMLTISNQLLSNTNNITLPTGPNKANGNNRQSFTMYNGVNSDEQYNCWLEVKSNNQSESEYYFIDEGTLTINSSSNGKYTITADVDIFYYDNNNKTKSAGRVVATYTGNIYVENCTSGGGGGGNQEAYTFTANDCWAGYYGDFLGYGTGVYLVQLTEGAVNDNGDLTTPGNSMMLAIINQLLSNTNNLILPTGIYNANGVKKQSYTIYNGLNADDQYNTWLEVWEKGQSQSEYYFIEDGTLTIEKTSSGKYTITADVDIFYYDNNDKAVSAGQVIAKYTGNVNVVDCTSGGGGGGTDVDPYEPLTSNVNLGAMTDMDCYFYRFTKSLLGNYFIRLYDVSFDEQGYANSEGYILTLDICTDYSDNPDLNMINGEYKVATLDEFEENTFQPGYVYFDEEENDYVWWGTYVDEIIKSSGNFVYGRAGLITSGNVIASHEGSNLVLNINLVTENGKKVTGSYKGIPTVNDEGSIDWTKARKAKAEKRYDIMPFAKNNRRNAQQQRSRHTAVSAQPNYNITPFSSNRRGPIQQNRRQFGISASQAQGNPLLITQP